MRSLCHNEIGHVAGAGLGLGVLGGLNLAVKPTAAVSVGVGAGVGGSAGTAIGAGVGASIGLGVNLGGLLGIKGKKHC